MWGYIPSSGHEQFSADIRWTGILQQKLGKDYEVIEEGLNSRTLNSNDQRDRKKRKKWLNILNSLFGYTRSNRYCNSNAWYK